MDDLPAQPQPPEQPPQPRQPQVPRAAARRRDVELDVPPEAEVGTYADFVSIWHTPEAFVLDFAILRRPPHPGTAEDGTPTLTFPTRVVTRVRVPPAQVFEIMKALESQLTLWEAETGRAG